MIAVGGFILWRFTPLGDMLDREVLIAQLEALRSASWAWPLMVGLLAAAGIFCAPVSPIMLANGAVFGLLGGWAATLAGTFIGGWLGFVLSRSLGQDLFLHLLRRTGLERVEHTLERHGFWTLVRIRFLPIPFGIINYAAGLTKMNTGKYLAASALTIVPVSAVYTYIGYALMTVAEGEKTGLLWGAGIALVVLFLLSWVPGRKLRREVEIDEEVAD